MKRCTGDIQIIPNPSDRGKFLFHVMPPIPSSNSIISIGGDFIMEKILPGHLIGFGSVADVERYEDYVWHGGAMSEIGYNVYRDIPSKKECDRICEELSGECITKSVMDIL